MSGDLNKQPKRPWYALRWWIPALVLLAALLVFICGWFLDYVIRDQIRPH
jgi:hypothetical protein